MIVSSRCSRADCGLDGDLDLLRLKEPDRAADPENLPLDGAGLLDTCPDGAGLLDTYPPSASG